MPGVFTVDREFKIILRKEAVKLTTYLHLLDEKTLLYVVLSEDYTYSHYKLKPKTERQQLAIRRVWGSNPPNLSEIENLKESILEYQSLIFDSLKFKRDTYTSKLVQLGKSLDAESEPARISSILKAIDLIEERLNIIDSEIDRNEEKIQLAGDRKISLIERLMRKRKEYRDMMNQ